MTASWAELPPPRDDDDDDVAWALQTAQVQWKRGSPADAIVWLRRAADSAVECGARARADELELAARQLTERFVDSTEQPSAAPSSRNPFLARDSLSDDPFGSASSDVDDGLDEIPIGIDDFGGEAEDSASRFAGEALRRISTAPPAGGGSERPARSSSLPPPSGQPPALPSVPPAPAPPLKSERPPLPAPPAPPRSSAAPAPSSSGPPRRRSHPPARTSSLPPPRITPEPPISSPSPSETELSLGLLAELESDEAGGLEPEPDVLSTHEVAEPISVEEVEEFEPGEVTEIDPPDVMEHLSELPPVPESADQQGERELRASLSEELASDLSKQLESIESARDRGLRPSLSEELAASLAPGALALDDDDEPSPSLADALEPEEQMPALADDLEPEEDFELEADAEEVEDEADSGDDDEIFEPPPGHRHSSVAPPRVAPRVESDRVELPNSVQLPSATDDDGSESDEPAVRGVSLLEVEGLEDLPEPAQLELARVAKIERLNADEELNDFGVALVTEGTVSIMPTIADAVCGRASRGDVVFTRGTLDEGVLLRVVADEPGAEVAVWDSETLAGAMKDCPWVDDELRVIADRFQALAGASLGAMGDRLDAALRALVTDRCEVVSRGAGEDLLGFGQPVDGMYVVGAGRVELVDPDGRVLEDLGPGDFLFAAQVMGGGAAPATARAGGGGALLLKATRSVAHELLVSVPPLLEILAG